MSGWYRWGLGVAVLGGLLGSGMASAQDAEHALYNLKGFRSAHFGMTEAQVRAAVAKDFKKGIPVDRSIVPDGRTPVIIVKAPSLFAGSGTAEVAYIFGYRSDKLMQVSITWSAQTDATLNADKLVLDGKILQNYFLGLAYPPKQVVVNQGATIGLVLFQGIDPSGHATALLLQGPMAKEADGHEALTPQILRLNYVADPAHPDIMKSLAGQF